MIKYKYNPFAEVVELVDAPAWGAGEQIARASSSLAFGTKF